jgi:hypothetical protein
MNALAEPEENEIVYRYDTNESYEKLFQEWNKLFLERQRELDERTGTG